MATANELFLELKKQASNGFIELTLTQIDDNFSRIQGLFNDFSFDIGNIIILSETENKLKIKAFSQDFLFKKTVFKNESVSIEAEFTFLNDKVEVLAICKLNKTPKKLSKLPGIVGDILKPLDFVEITDLVYVITTKEMQVITSETFPEYNNKSVNFKSGINLAGFIDLKNSDNVVSLITKPLKPVIGEGPYFMSWNMKDKVDVDFSLNLPQDINIESLFKIKQPKLVIKPINPAQVSIDGLFEIQLPPLLNVSVLGGFSYTTDGVRGKFNLDKVAEKIPAPFGYPGVHLTTLTVSAGISNGVANVGAEGNFYIGPNKPDNISNKPKVAEFGDVASNQFKFKFNALPGEVTPQFFYMYLDNLNLEEYLKALSNQNINLPSFLKKVSIEQLMIHWCEPKLVNGEVKPDGTIGKPVFGFSAVANIFGHRTFAELYSGISETSGNFIASPITITYNNNVLLGLKGNGKPPLEYKGKIQVSSGGIEFKFKHKNGDIPNLAFSAKIEILGLSSEIVGDVKDNGIAGKVKSNVAGLLKSDLSLVLNNNNFDVSTEIYAGIRGIKVPLGNLGTIKLDTYLEGGFSANYLNGKYTNKMRLHFMFVGVKFNLGELEIEVIDLKKIVSILESEIRNAVEKLGENVLAWLKATFEKVIVFIEDTFKEIGVALKDSFKVAMDNAAELMKSVGYQANQVGQTLMKGYKASEKEVAIALKKAGYLVNEIAKVLKDIYKIGDQVCAEILKGLDYSAKEIGLVLKGIFELGDKTTATILRNLKFTADDCAKVLTDVYKLSGKAASAAMKVAGYPAKELNNALGKIIPGWGDGPKCILTSASVAFKGLPDDCYELELLRNFRDTFMSKLPNGEQLIEEYYSLSDAIIEKVKKDKIENEFYERVFNELIIPSVKLIEGKQHDNAFQYYRNYVLNTYNELIKG